MYYIINPLAKKAFMEEQCILEEYLLANFLWPFNPVCSFNFLTWKGPITRLLQTSSIIGNFTSLFRINMV